MRSSEHVPNLTPQQPPLTLGTAIPQNNNAPLPPPPPPMPTPKQLIDAARENSANTTGKKSSIGTTQKNTPHPKKLIPPKDTRQVSISNDTIINARANLKKSVQPTNSMDGQQKDGGLMDGLFTRIKERRKGIIGNEKSDEQQSNELEGAYSKMSDMIPPPRSRSSSVLSDSGNVPDDEDWDTNPEPIEQASSGSPSSKEERSKSTDSGHGSGDDVESKATSPVCPEQKTEEPPSSCVDLPSTAQVNNVNSVNSGVQNSPITETSVDTKEQNSSGSAGSYTNKKDNESGLDSDAESESKERAARIEREQTERKKKKQEEVNSEIQDPSALSMREYITLLNSRECSKKCVKPHF